MRTVAREAEIPSEVEGGYRKPQPGLAHGEGDEPEWIVLIIVTSTFGAFFVRFFGEAGADSWRALKKFAEQLRDSRRQPTGPRIPPSPPHVGAIEFRDQYGNRLEEGIYPTGPSDHFWKGWQRISEPDWSKLDGWFAYWDNDRETWAAFKPSSSRHVYWSRRSFTWVEFQGGHQEPVAHHFHEPKTAAPEGPTAAQAEGRNPGP